MTLPGWMHMLPLPICENSFMDVELGFSQLRFHFPHRSSPSLPTPVQHIIPFPSPLYIHYRPDYANIGSFMSSVLRIFSSPRVCKEVCYHHRPIVECFLRSTANPLPRSPQYRLKCCTIVSHSKPVRPRKATGR